jgi:hypothetical protein
MLQGRFFVVLAKDIVSCAIPFFPLFASAGIFFPLIRMALAAHVTL